MGLSKIFAQAKMEHLAARGLAYPPGSFMRNRAARALVTYGNALPADSAMIAMVCASEALFLARENGFVARDAMNLMLAKADAAFERDRETTLSILEKSTATIECVRHDIAPMLKKRYQLLNPQQ